MTEIRADWATKDFYKVHGFGVGKNASTADVKKAYRKLARDNHPDSNPGDDKKHETFKAVAEAYDVVGDPEKRKAYDDYRSQVLGPFPGGFGGGGFRPPGGFDIDDVIRGHSGGIGDMLGDMFGGGAGRAQRQQTRASRPVRGSDVAVLGHDRFHRLGRGRDDQPAADLGCALPPVPRHGGQARHQAAHLRDVRGCGLRGVRGGRCLLAQRDVPGLPRWQLVYDEPCPTCHGSGRGSSARTIQARIPAGVKDGQRIRLRGKGSQGENGGPAGDLFVTVKVTPHRLFGRKDDNLTLDVPVSFDEAALGADVKIPTLGGAPVTLKILQARPTAAPSGCAGAVPRRRTAPTATCSRPSRSRCRPCWNEKAREAVVAYRVATEGSTLRSNLFEQAQA